MMPAGNCAPSAAGDPNHRADEDDPGTVYLKSFGSDAGFSCEFPESRGNEARFNIIKCPYYETCLRYGCPEITRAFCDGDDAGYGKLHPKLIWCRSKTIGRGGDCCDFLLA